MRAPARVPQASRNLNRHAFCDDELLPELPTTLPSLSHSRPLRAEAEGNNFNDHAYPPIFAVRPVLGLSMRTLIHVRLYVQVPKFCPG